MEEASYDDINTAFNKLSLNHSIIKEATNSENESQDSVLSTCAQTLTLFTIT